MSQVLEIKYTTSPVRGGDWGRLKPGAGGDLNWTRIVPGTIRSLYQGKSPLIRSDGQHIRNCIYVKDVSRAYLALAEHMDFPAVRGGGSNFSPEAGLTVLEIVDRIRNIMKCEHIESTVLNEAKGEIPDQYLIGKG